MNKDNNNLLEEMAKSLPRKLADDIKDHYNVLLKISISLNVEWRKRASWAEQEHRSVSSTVLDDDINNLN
ncbi:hypothetical protein R3W88_029529 [Solanum pinnatisectum]|uniref:Uncharacterized protein n=1 Tax=Solanum pinnatisectum TaxID=50273 RepID=A0AAV9K7L3_9SOLN|nr:hypothetical protein R3W88_029529 [Solanum pinnatisectum]